MDWKFWPFIAFIMLQVRFSNHQLMKISIIYLHVKSEVKNDTKAMTTAINEACIGWLHENCYLVREIFLVQKMRRDSPQSTRFSPNSRFGGGGKGSPYMVWATSKMKGGETFLVRWRIQWVYLREIILLDTVLY